jgi:hypothetical protein
LNVAEGALGALVIDPHADAHELLDQWCKGPEKSAFENSDPSQHRRQKQLIMLQQMVVGDAARVRPETGVKDLLQLLGLHPQL